MSEYRPTFKKGQRVQLHASCDDWMRGDRYGEVIGFGRAREYLNTFTKKLEICKPVRVKLDKSGIVKRFHPTNLYAI